MPAKWPVDCARLGERLGLNLHLYCCCARGATARAVDAKPVAVQFGLRYQRDQALPAPRECWVVWSDADGDEEIGVTRGWCIDPATGVFVTRLSGYGRIEPLH